MYRKASTQCPKRNWLSEPKPIQSAPAVAQPSQLRLADSPAILKSQGKISLDSQRPRRATTTAAPSNPTSPIIALALIPDPLASDTGNRLPTIISPYKSIGANTIPQRTCQVIPEMPH